MPKKGKSNNPNGRPKGIPNKLTKELRESLKTVIAGHIEQIGKDLDELPAKDRLEILVKLLAYILPKVEDVNPGYGEPLDFDLNDL
ncbi:MAG: DUF5681 domain-containing protein [Candidatus Marinimicrobia bacterium]|nr:DUF5681 domain-containing protein [Candidatus Neomarinimicrobiota bacterium]